MTGGTDLISLPDAAAQEGQTTLRVQKLFRWIARMILLLSALTICYWLFSSDRYVSEAIVIVQNTEQASAPTFELATMLGGIGKITGNIIECRQTAQRGKIVRRGKQRRGNNQQSKLRLPPVAKDRGGSKKPFGIQPALRLPSGEPLEFSGMGRQNRWARPSPQNIFMLARKIYAVCIQNNRNLTAAQHLADNLLCCIGAPKTGANQHRIHGIFFLT